MSVRGRAITALQASLTGRVLSGGDRGWQSARRAWNPAIEQSPAFVVEAQSAADVQAVCRYASAEGMRIALQSTGHGADSLVVSRDTILLKTGNLREVDVDSDKRRARVLAGVQWAAVAERAADLSLVALAGSSRTVGVVGYTLGGGVGWLARRYGAACSRVVAADVVTASGAALTVDRSSDLLWALCGGGGSFAAVTALEFELIPNPELYGGVMAWPAEHATEVLCAWRRWTEDLPEEMTSVGRLLRAPGSERHLLARAGQLVVAVEFVWCGSAASGVRVTEPLRALRPQWESAGPLRGQQLQDIHMEPASSEFAAGNGSQLCTLNDSAVERFVAAVVEEEGVTLSSAEIRHAGGNLARQSATGDTATDINGEYLVYCTGASARRQDLPRIRMAADSALAALEPITSRRNYMNFCTIPVASSSLHHPATHARLRAIKTRYDPMDTFVANHPIVPYEE